MKNKMRIRKDEGTGKEWRLVKYKKHLFILLMSSLLVPLLLLFFLCLMVILTLSHTT